MANSANRNIDFAPAWLKLPEQSQERRQELNQNSYHQSHHLVKHSTNNHSGNNSHQVHQPGYNHQIHSHIYSSGHHPSQHHSGRGNGRPTLNFNGRSHHNPPQRSQSTGSYSDNGYSKTVSHNTTSNPLEEDFPLLSGGSVSSPQSCANQTAQWRKLPGTESQRTRDDTNNSKLSLTSDKSSLTSNMSGKVYRAQVKPVRRTQMIPVNNGKTSVRTAENGEHGLSTLSSSVEKEKKLLQEMGWKEEDDSEDDCIIPEQDPEQLQAILEQAKAARERLRLKSKQSLKSISAVSAILPNEDDLPSSSDNSDAE